MREIFIDTETTGFDIAQGHRLIEIGAVEIIDNVITGVHYHIYLYPEREVDESAVEVHGIPSEFLTSQPLFREIAVNLLRFIDRSAVVGHNVAFYLEFINEELRLIGEERIDLDREIIDTLEMAKRLHPAEKNNLDSLCDRYAIGLDERYTYGALLDAELGAEIYLKMKSQLD